MAELPCRSTQLHKSKVGKCIPVYIWLSLQRSILHAMRSQILAELFFHHCLVIRPVAEIHLRCGVAFEDDQMGADAVEEPAIMTDDQCSACIFFECFLEGAQCV